MPPFREAPGIELGPLDVGLADAAANAMRRLPDGGRLIAPTERGIAPHRAGAIGSVGLMLALFAATAISTSMEPAGVGLNAAIVAAAAVSLALILRAFDGATPIATNSGALVGRAARRLLVRLMWLARRAERRPEDFGPRQLASLRRSLAFARDPRIAHWLPRDVVGRAELLLARANALLAGRRWVDDRTRAGRIAGMLESAARKLDDPSPAQADLRAILERTGGAAPLRLDRSGIRLRWAEAQPPPDEEDMGAASDAAAVRR